MGCTILEQAVEMQRGGCIPQAILDIDDEPVSDVCSYDGQWPLIVDAYCGPLELAIWICSDPGDIKIISDRLCVGEEREDELKQSYYIEI